MPEIKGNWMSFPDKGDWVKLDASALCYLETSRTLFQIKSEVADTSRPNISRAHGRSITALSQKQQLCGSQRNSLRLIMINEYRCLLEIIINDKWRIRIIAMLVIVLRVLWPLADKSRCEQRMINTFIWYFVLMLVHL